MRCHTRMVFTPTGPAHLGHAYMASVNRRLALNTGGSFLYRFETEQARMSGVIAGVDLRHGRVQQAVENYEDMQYLGLEQANTEQYSPSWGENFEITKWQYRNLGMEECFGPWPTPYYKEMGYNPDALSFATGFQHPFLTLSHVVEDLYSGRNCIVRGPELERERDLYLYLTYRITRRKDTLPIVCSIPAVHRLVNNQKPRLSSSMPEETGNMTVQALIQAGRTAEEFWSWFDKRVFTTDWSIYWCSPEEVLRYIRQPLLIVQEEWDKFLEDGQP